MSEIIIGEHHDQVYNVWQERGMKNLNVAHVDYHCDMRGILINRPNGTAQYISKRESAFVDRGNYLAHAIMDGMVNKLKWVHDINSGRGFDHGPVVNYESDFMAPLYQLRHKLSGREAVKFEYQQCLLSNWKGMEKDQQLDLDWDALASVEFDDAYQNNLIEGFLSKDLKNTPPVTFLIYSPGYSNPDRTLFDDFAKELSKKFKAKITTLPQTELVTDGERFSALRNIAKSILPPQVKTTKQAITRKLRQVDIKNDLSFYA